MDELSNYEVCGIVTTAIVLRTVGLLGVIVLAARLSGWMRK